MAEQRSKKDSEGGGENQLRDYLVKLATDAAELGRFVKDPDASMEGAGLSADERAALRSGNPSAIYARLSGAGASASSVTVLVVDLEPGAEGAPQTPTIRGGYGTILGGGQPVYPQYQLIFPQIHPIYPQIYPQIHPVFPQQIFPQQIHPIFPQIYPQIHPIYQVFPQIHPLVYPVVEPLSYGGRQG